MPTVQRAGGLPRRSSPGPPGPLTCRCRKIGAHDALPSRRRFCVFWESAAFNKEGSRLSVAFQPRDPVDDRSPLEKFGFAHWDSKKDAMTIEKPQIDAGRPKFPREYLSPFCEISPDGR